MQFAIKATEGGMVISKWIDSSHQKVELPPYFIEVLLNSINNKAPGIIRFRGLSYIVLIFD